MSESENKKKIRASTVIICILTLLIISCAVSTIYLYTSNQLEYRKPHRYMELTYDLSSFNYTKEEVRNDLNELFGASLYIYKEEHMNHAYGLTRPFMRTVTMDTNMSIPLYTFVLAHEFVHLTHFTASERYCNLVAFKTLYNTDKYRDVAIKYAMLDRDGYISSDYSCWEYIYDYLTEET